MLSMRFVPLFFVLALAFACDTSERGKRGQNNAVVSSPIVIQFESGNSNFSFGDEVVVQVSAKDSGVVLTDITVYLNENLIESPTSIPINLSISTDSLLSGRNIIRVSANILDGRKSKSASFILFPNKSPDAYYFKVTAIYPHDKAAYTQGLFFHNGLLYEGTGQRGYSNLRQVNLEDGKIIKNQSLERTLFGEGIVYHNGFIYQLTWNSQLGIIYNSEDLSEVRRFYYNGEGWGLTSDSTYLIRSDGTNKLHFHHPDDFNLVKTIEVYTKSGPLDKLNELEYINGKIYANIYQRNQIAIINPLTGVVEGLINLKGILPKKYQTAEDDVLNGIAFDAVNNRIFVTGKYWSKLFEIEVIKKVEG